jgi:hypothetical protein
MRRSSTESVASSRSLSSMSVRSAITWPSTAWPNIGCSRRKLRSAAPLTCSVSLASSARASVA